MTSLGGSYVRDEITSGLRGTTAQAGRIAGEIANGNIKVNILGDELFDRMYDGAFKGYSAGSRGTNIYLRQSSSSFLSETVHEGTHALDYFNGYGASPLKTIQQWENRAWFYERQYQIWTGGPDAAEFPNIKDMFDHVRSYPGATQVIARTGNSWKNL